MNSTLRKPLPPVDPLNPRVYLDLQLGGEQVAGRLIFELFVERAPRAAEAFRVFATGELGACPGTGTTRSFVGVTASRIAEGEALDFVGADRRSSSPASAQPVAGACDCSRLLEADGGSLPHDRSGLLSTAPQGSGGACGRLPFAVTLGRAAPLAAAGCVVFGRLIRGYGLLHEIERLAVDGRGAPATQVRVAACGELGESDDGVVVSPDGDPYPSWPQDYPGFALGAGADAVAAARVWPARLGAGETIRALGNEAFAARDWAAAAERYAKALRYIERPPSREAEQAEEEHAYGLAARRLAAPLRLNAAAALLKLGRWREAEAHCSDVLAAAAEAAAAFGAPAPDAAATAQLAKAHFRRGCARARLREFAEAEADLARAAALAPADAAAANSELAALRRAAAERSGRLRAAYANAFGGE